DGRLDDVRDEPLVGDVVEVLELLSGELRVAAEVVVGPVVNALELVPPEGERELDVRRRGGVVRALVGGVVAKPQLVLWDALLDMPLKARFLPLFVETRRVGRAREVLDLHLLELARAEDEIDLRDVVVGSPAGPTARE